MNEVNEFYLLDGELIHICFNNYEIDSEYRLGHGLLGILNYNIRSLIDKIDNYIEANLDIDNDTKPFYKFENELIKKLTEFHPYFSTMQTHEIQQLVIDRLILILIRNSLVIGYEKIQFNENNENPLYVDIPKLGNAYEINPIPWLQFANYCLNLIGTYQGFDIDYSNTRKQFSEIFGEEDDIFEDELAFTFYKYNYYLNFYYNDTLKFASLSRDILQIRNININLYPSYVEELFDMVLYKGDSAQENFIEYLSTLPNEDTHVFRFMMPFQFKRTQDTNGYIAHSFNDLLTIELKCMIMEFRNFSTKLCNKCQNFFIAFHDNAKLCEKCKVCKGNLYKCGKCTKPELIQQLEVLNNRIKENAYKYKQSYLEKVINFDKEGEQSINNLLKCFRSIISIRKEAIVDLKSYEQWLNQLYSEFKLAIKFPDKRDSFFKYLNKLK